MRGGSGGTLERGGAGGAVPRRGGRPLGPACPGDLAAGEGSRGGRGGRDDRVRVRWVEKLLARYNAGGPDALGDLRRRNGTRPTILTPELLDKLRARLAEPPPDGGLWSSRKAAAWMAGELGLAAVAVQRGWEALRAVGWPVQVPRPEHPARATAEEREAFEKSSPPSSPKRRGSIRARPSKSSPRTSTASG